MKNIEKEYDNIIIGAGASGMMAAIISARAGKRVLVLEKLKKVAQKLKATGGGRCNLTNTLENDIFMSYFGKNGRFMTKALEELNYKKLIEFFSTIGVETHAPDGYRVFPITHDSSTVVDAMRDEMKRLNIEVLSSQRVIKLLTNQNSIIGVQTKEDKFYAKKVILATGGNGYAQLGAEGDGYKLAEALGHKVTEIYPAMMPLKVKESWIANCRADTIAKVSMYVDIKKYKKLKAKGDLIFTKNGIRGPVVLDFSREITPLLSKLNEVPLYANFTKGKNEEQIRVHFKNMLKKNSYKNILELVETLLPHSLSIELCKLAKVDKNKSLNKVDSKARDELIRLLAWTPLTVNGHDGFKMAMITRGGLSLKDIDPNTMQSKKINGLYFCGEVMDLDGPCGGYNLQWAFASGYLAGLK